MEFQFKTWKALVFGAAFAVLSTSAAAYQSEIDKDDVDSRFCRNSNTNLNAATVNRVDYAANA